MSQATPELVAGSFIVLDVDVSALSKETIAFIRSNPIWEDPDLGEDICEVQELEVQKGYNRLSDKAKDEVSDISFEAFRRMACYVRLIRQ